MSEIGFRHSKKTGKKYEIVTKLGQGNFGKVYLVKQNGSDKLYAMKIIPNVNTNPFIIEGIENQIRIMDTVKSIYTLNIVEAFIDQQEGEYYIITDYMEYGDLRKSINTKELKKTTIELVGLLAQIALGFIELNSKKILHRDLKPENILVDKDGTYKLCDFGCSKFLDSSVSQFLKCSKPFGTQLYNSPQVYFGTNYNNTVDVWSMGVVLYEIIYGKGPIRQTHINEYMTNLRDGREKIDFSPVQDIDPKLIDLMRRMLEVNIPERINWNEIMDYLKTHFQFLIYSLDQILRHQIALVKMQCLAIQLLRSSKEDLEHFKITREMKNPITNCMVILQYDELSNTQSILKKSNKPQGYFIMPHVYEQFKDKNQIQEFEDRKLRNYEFRKVLNGEYPIKKIRAEIEKQSLMLSANLKGHENYSPHIAKLCKILDLLKNYRTKLVVVNKDWLFKLYESELHQEVN